jgi:hypothetical protein
MSLLRGPDGAASVRDAVGLEGMRLQMDHDLQDYRD